MGVEDAEREPRQVWGDQNQPTGLARHPHSQAETNPAGPGAEHLHLGADRAHCTGGTVRSCLAGGILTQLVSQAEDQLREAEESILWYQRSAEKARKQLENLQQLQQLAEQESQDD